MATCRPPTSTIFPYTTLFRSGAQGSGALALLQKVAPIVTTGTQHRIEGIEFRNGVLELEVQAPAVVALDALREGVATVPGLDRKSTRLNSSHGYISYAVFCSK